MKIIIVGKATGWRKAPYEGIVWGIHSHCFLRPFTMIWDMHKIDEDDSKIQASIIKHINDNKIPYMTLKKHENIPTSIEFPLEEMPVKYAECSIAYMIWYACHLGATEIDLFGVNMATDGEYKEQLKSTDYWVGYARGKGIEVTIYGGSSISKGKKGLYGYDFVTESNHQKVYGSNI